MSISEDAIIFSCAGDLLLGIVAQPDSATQDVAANRSPATAGETAVIIILGGPQYRAGSQRQFVTMARACAAAGYPALRFDYRGMGDSEGTQRSFETIDEDIASAIDATQKRCPQVIRIVLWGLCDGASAALLYWQRTRDSRIAGMCLLNPWTRSAATLARTHVKHYYLQRLTQREFWNKLASGRLAWRALTDLLSNLRLAQGEAAPASSGQRGATVASYQELMAEAAAGFEGPLLLVLSGQDYTAKEFLESVKGDERWQQCFNRDSTLRRDVDDADHTFSSASARQELQTQCVDWLLRCWPQQVAAPVQEN